MENKPTAKRARILIVDDHPAVREALAARISRQPDLEVCGEAAQMGEALRIIAECKPDVAVVDLSLKTGHGLELIKRIIDRTNHVRILVWSTYSDLIYAERSLRAGALGYITKDQATDKIVEAIRRVLEGKVYLSESMSERLLRKAVGHGEQESAQSRLDVLNDRELEIFRLMGEGLKNAEIAERLLLSVHTVETYRERIRIKMGLKSGELTHYALTCVKPKA